MIKIELTKEDTHDFTIIEKDGKKYAEFKNPDIAEENCYKIIDSDMPEILKEAYIFSAPFVFKKSIVGKYLKFGWDFPTMILAFKLGFIDGFMMNRNYFYKSLNGPGSGFIVVDEKIREEVRKFYETEYKEELDNIDEKDFNYVVYVRNRIGTRKDKTFEQILNEIKADGTDDLNEKEKEYVKKNGADKFFENVAKLTYYISDMIRFDGSSTANHLTFDSEEDAYNFIKDYSSWDMDIYGALDWGVGVTVANDKFVEWFLEKVKRTA